MNTPGRILFLSGPEDDIHTEPAMKFRLIYEGELRATQRDPRPEHPDHLAVHKQKIRREFHPQLKQLWATNKFLREHKSYPNDYLPRRIADDEARWARDPSGQVPYVDIVAEQFQKFGYRYVPLVCERISLLCSLEILFLRRDIPGSAIEAGDIDNRVKTIIDALRPIKHPNEVPPDDPGPQPGENPFFVLLEDDSQVTHFAVETDTLLDPPTKEDADKSKARIIITVELRPYNVDTFNLAFA